MDNISYFLCFDICNTICLDTSDHFFGFTFLNILCFSSTLVLTSSIDVVFILSISIDCIHSRCPKICIKCPSDKTHVNHPCQRYVTWAKTVYQVGMWLDNRFYSPGTSQLVPHCPWLPVISVQVLFHFKNSHTHKKRVVIWGCLSHWHFISGHFFYPVIYNNWHNKVLFQRNLISYLMIPCYDYRNEVSNLPYNVPCQILYHVVQFDSSSAVPIACTPNDCEGKSAQFGDAHPDLIRSQSGLQNHNTEWRLDEAVKMCTFLLIDISSGLYTQFFITYIPCIIAAFYQCCTPSQSIGPFLGCALLWCWVSLCVPMTNSLIECYFIMMFMHREITRWDFLDHAFMLHCKILPHLLA